MKYLVDSDVAIFYLKGYKKAVSVLQKFEGKLALSVISLGEILEGIYDTENEQDKLTTLGNFLSGVTLLEINENVAETFAKIRGRLRSENKLIENLDILIAATAIAYDLTLISGNVRHFERVEGLKLLSKS